MPILSVIFAWLVERFGLSAVKTAIVGAAKAVSWIMVIAVYGFAITGVLKVVELFQTLLNKVMSLGSTSGAVANQINAVFHCTGIWSAFENVFPVLFSSIVFVLVIVLNSLLMSVKNRLEKDILDFVKLL